MFIAPINYSPLTTLEELENFSKLEGYRPNNPVKAYCTNNGVVAYTDANNTLWVTPSRPEITELLEKEGFERKSFCVPYSNGEKRDSHFMWLAKIATEETWNYTYAQAMKIAEKRQLQIVDFRHAETKYRITEINSDYIEELYTTPPESRPELVYSPMTMQYLMNETDQNIGTYIIIDSKKFLVCDGYGRTYLVETKSCINELINMLILAGYSRTQNPQFYVKNSLF